MKITAFPFLVLLLITASCSVRQEIYLNSDGSGKVAGQVRMDQFYLNTLQDLTDLSAPAEGKGSAMDPLQIGAGLSQNPYFQGVQIAEPSPGLYQGGLQFHDVEDLFYTEEGVPSTVVSFRENSNSSTLEIRINEENFQEIFRLFPVLQDPGFQYFLPEQAITRDEYIEMLLFLFEDQHEGTEEELRSRIEKASLDLIIHTSGKILSSSGGGRTGEQELTIKVPLLDLLLHQKELFYSVTFK